MVRLALLVFGSALMRETTTRTGLLAWASATQTASGQAEAPISDPGRREEPVPLTEFSEGAMWRGTPMPPLTSEARRRLCERVDAGRPISHIAAEAGISRRCLVTSVSSRISMAQTLNVTPQEWASSHSITSAVIASRLVSLKISWRAPG